MEDDVTCPMCLDIFKDPCFVCPNHHTLCRKCHTGLVSRSHGKGQAQCPQCRERLTRPVENSQMRGLINAYQIAGKWPKQAACQAKIEETDDKCACRRRVFNHCAHCDRNLCDLHFSADRLKFQDECQKLLSIGETASRKAKAKEALLASWSGLFDVCIRNLEQRRERLLKEEQLPAAESSESLLKSVDSLRDALTAGDMRSAKAALVKLQKLIPVERNDKPNFVESPSSKENRTMLSWISALVDTMELRYRRAVHPTLAVVVKSKMYWWIQAVATTVSNWVGALLEALAKLKEH